MTIKYAKFIQGTVGNEAIVNDGIAQVAFIGRSNVGKSSTLNALAGRKNLVKVGRTPGKTREINFFDIQFDVGEHLYFVDLPGYGYALLSKTARQELFERIRAYLGHQQARIELVVLILDAKAGLTENDKEVIEYLEEMGRPLLLAVNKIDKLNQKERSQLSKKLREEIGGADIVMYSASIGKHINLLEDAIKMKIGITRKG